MRECSIPACEKPHRARGLCWMHYRRLLRTGTTDLEYINKDKECYLKDCHNPAKVRGLCNKHWVRLAKHGDVFELKRPSEIAQHPCIMLDCEDNIRHSRLLLCHNHYHNYMYHFREGHISNLIEYIKHKEDSPQR